MSTSGTPNHQKKRHLVNERLEVRKLFAALAGEIATDASADSALVRIVGMPASLTPIAVPQPARDQVDVAFDQASSLARRNTQAVRVLVYGRMRWRTGEIQEFDDTDSSVRFTLKNIRRKNLRIQSVSVQSDVDTLGTPAFEVTSPGRNKLRTGQRTSFFLKINADEPGEWKGVITVTTNARLASVYRIPVRVVIEQTTGEYRRQSVSSTLLPDRNTVQYRLRVQNTGHAPLTIDTTQMILRDDAGIASPIARPEGASRFVTIDPNKSKSIAFDLPKSIAQGTVEVSYVKLASGTTILTGFDSFVVHPSRDAVNSEARLTVSAPTINVRADRVDYTYTIANGGKYESLNLDTSKIFLTRGQSRTNDIVAVSPNRFIEIRPRESFRLTVSMSRSFGIGTLRIPYGGYGTGTYTTSVNVQREISSLQARVNVTQADKPIIGINHVEYVWRISNTGSAPVVINPRELRFRGASAGWAQIVSNQEPFDLKSGQSRIIRAQFAKSWSRGVMTMNYSTDPGQAPTQVSFDVPSVLRTATPAKLRIDAGGISVTRNGSVSTGRKDVTFLIKNIGDEPLSINDLGLQNYGPKDAPFLTLHTSSLSTSLHTTGARVGEREFVLRRGETITVTVGLNNRNSNVPTTRLFRIHSDVGNTWFYVGLNKKIG